MASVKLKNGSILFALLGKMIIFMDAMAGATPEKWKFMVTESLKNMVAIIFCLAIWLIRCLIQSVNTFLPSSISITSLVDTITITGQGEGEEDITSDDDLAGSAIGRALSQILALVNETPVNSKKYEFVRNLADKMIDENLKSRCQLLGDVNRAALSAGFGRTLKLLISALHGLRDDRTGGMMRRIPFCSRLIPYLDNLWGYLNNRLFIRSSSSTANSYDNHFLARTQTTTAAGESVLAEKLGAELLWLAEKLAVCSAVEEAIVQWSEASSLANLSASAQPRVQVSLVRVSVFLFKELAKEMEVVEEGRRVKMLMSWLPLFSHATNGVESLVLSVIDKYEMEKLLEKIIEALTKTEDKEAVLANWLHHYTHSSSDWPNLQRCYHEWCSHSRSSLC